MITTRFTPSGRACAKKSPGVNPFGCTLASLAPGRSGYRERSGLHRWLWEST
jgi:hypothetical protein